MNITGLLDWKLQRLHRAFLVFKEKSFPGSGSPVQIPRLMSSVLVWEHVQVNDITVNLCHAPRHPDVANKDNKEGKTTLLMIMSPP